MRYTSPGDVLVLKRASMGPAAMAARAHRLANGAPYGSNYRAAQMMRAGGSMGTRSPPRIAPRLGHFSRYGALGQESTGAQVGSAAASYGAKVGGASLAAYAGAGAWAGPIGIAAGVIVGIVVTKLLTKNYINVPQLNQKGAIELDVFRKYKAIQGKIPGRALGLPTMVAIWKGAEHAGYFPLAGQTQCFHEGCLAYKGRGDWIDSTVGRGDAAYQFPRVYQAWLAGRSRSSRAVTPNVMRVGRGGGSLQLRGYVEGFFGGLGAVSSVVPDAVTFVDQYFIPAAASGDRLPWEVPRNSVEHQLLYDVADAYLYTQPVDTTPYLAIPTNEAAAAGYAPVAPAAAVQGGGTSLPPAAPGGPGQQGQTPTVGLPATINPADGTQTTITTQTGAEVTPGGASAGAALSVPPLPPWGWLVVATLGVFALTRSSSNAA